MLWVIIPLLLLTFHPRDAHGRNETVHACELVIKCFDDADSELMKCQGIISAEPSGFNAIANDAPFTNETTVEPTTPAPSDDCMAPVKAKMQQKKALIEQRAQAFALCLNERMGRGPEDVDPRKFRYCNTVISRYNARTTAPPEFTFGSTTANLESTQTTQQHRLPTTTSSTAFRKSSQVLVTVTNHPRSSSNPITTTRSPLSSSQPRPQNAIRPRRQAAGGNLELETEQEQSKIFAAAATSNGSNGDIIRPPGVSAPGRRSESTASVEPITVTLRAITPDSIDQQSSTVAGAPKQELPQQQAPQDGRIAAVARFSSTGQGNTGDKPAVPSKNGTADINPETPPQSTFTAQEVAVNQTRQFSAGTPQLEPRSGENVPAQPPPVTPAAPGNPINYLGVSSPNGLNIPQPTPLPDNRNGSLPLRAQNNSNSGIAVLVQQQEQTEPGVAVPLDTPIIDVPAQELPSPNTPPQWGQSSQNARTVSTQPRTTQSATTTTGAPVAAQNPNANANADERQRNRAETVRESRRRVSEFKACMARARIKREECKPMVNCCPDSVKCHLRYELSELHDQIHRLELEISEGRQACLEKKKVDDAAVDALDQIDEEDLVSDESIVSQQVF